MTIFVTPLLASIMPGCAPPPVTPPNRRDNARRIGKRKGAIRLGMRTLYLPTATTVLILVKHIYYLIPYVYLIFHIC